MWRLWLVGLAGCGRIAFEPHAGGADAAHDAAAIRDSSTMPDGPPDAAVDAFACTLPNYAPIEGFGCYRIALLADADEVVWSVAEAACEADGAGAHLAILDDAAEATRVANAIASANDVMIGFSDRVTEGVYIDVTGAPQMFLGWQTGEPDAPSDCGKIRVEGLAIDDCSVTEDYICEYDGRSVDPNAF